MRFKKYQGNVELIQQNAVLKDVIARVKQEIPIRLVCVLQNSGIHTVSEISNYIEFAQDMGINDVVFRELAMFGDSVERGATQQYIDDNRIETMNLFEQLPENSYTLKHIDKGYYYFSFSYLYESHTHIAFEMSDYEKMIEHHSKIDE